MFKRIISYVEIITLNVLIAAMCLTFVCCRKTSANTSSSGGSSGSSAVETVPKASRASSGEIGRDGRFIAYDNGTVLDTKTHLMWAGKDNGKDIDWTNAVSYCANYRGGGFEDWRMPTTIEAAGLFDKMISNKVEESDYKGEVHLTKLIHITNMFVWTSETRGSDASSFFYQQDGGGLWMPKSLADSHRTLPVRSAEATDSSVVSKEPSAAMSARRAPAPDAMDYRAFGLKLGPVTVLNEIVSQMLGTVRVTPQEGNRLIAVALKGNIPRAMSLKIATHDFWAKFDQTEKDAAGVWYNGIWIVSGNLDGTQTIASSTSFKANKAGPLSLKVAFEIPQTVKLFDVFCNDLTLGGVTAEASSSTPQ